MAFSNRNRHDRSNKNANYSKTFKLCCAIFIFAFFFSVYNSLHYHVNDKNGNGNANKNMNRNGNPVVTNLNALYKNNYESQFEQLHISNAVDAFLQSDESGFDHLRQKLYTKAISSSSSKTKKRHKINVTEWKGRPSTWGGLFGEDRAYISELYYNATSLFEFGLGESTYLAATTNIPRYAGVDSDAQWVANARDYAMTYMDKKRNSSSSNNNKNSNDDYDENDGSSFRFYFADVGPTLVWGKPSNQQLAKIFYDYQIAPLVSEFKHFDVYMIDGRYRVACACVSFLHALKYGRNSVNGNTEDVRKNVRVAIHDATARENSFGKYGQLGQIADVVGKSSELWVYRLKDDVSEKEIYKLWKRNTNIQFRRRRLDDTSDLNSRRILADTDNDTYESRFDLIQRETYERAVHSIDSLQTTRERKSSLDLWKEMEDDSKEHGLEKIDFDILGKLYYDASSVFEFGVGPMSKVAIHTNITRYAACDSRASSLSKIRNATIDAEMEHFRFFFSDIGETDEDGTAINGDISKLWYDFSIAPLVIEREAFDLYVIDGRRYALFSICMSFLHAMKHGSDMTKVTIIVYDKSGDSVGLQSLENIAGSFVERPKLKMFRLKPAIQEKDIYTLLLQQNYF